MRVNGRRIRVARRGEGRPLLLITGIGANIEMWQPLARLLHDRELIAFDAPGAGRSDRPVLPTRMRGLAAITNELLAELGRERVDVLGYSFGGALAQELAYRHPNRVRRLVLCATSLGIGGVPPRPVAGLLLATPARYYHPRLLRMTLPLLAGGRTSREPAVLDGQAAARLLHPPDPLGYALQLYAAAGWSSLPWLRRLQQRTLVIAGDDDPAVPPGNARRLAARIARSELQLLGGAGHLFLIDEPERATPSIVAFLDDDE